MLAVPAFVRDANAAEVEPDEMRRERDDRRALEAAQVLDSHDMDHLEEILVRSPHELRKLERAATEHFEMSAPQRLALAFRHAREAEREVDVGHASAPETVEDRAEGCAHRGEP